VDLELRDRTALVTGGSRGIGRATARQLAREGARVAIVARGAEGVRRAVAELERESDGGTVLGFTADMGVAGDVARACREAAEALGTVEILVNNAATAGGRTPALRWDAVTADDLGAEMDVKVLGYLRAAQALAPGMVERGWGRIINVGGGAAWRTGNAVGSIRNAAVAVLSKNLADALGPKGVGVVCVHPGLVRTVRSEDAATPEEAEAARRIEEAVPKGNTLRRMLDAEHVADVLTFLASPRSMALHGEIIGVAGGAPVTIRA
jgi:NAD(P)-dependent dehydrogenase (short-subunit alcohol dehydrogenase family)